MPLRTTPVFLLIAVAAASAFALRAADWPTFGHDAQRSGWAFEERTLKPENVSGLELKWKTKLPASSYKLSALTAPIVVSRVSTSKGVRTVVYTAGIQGTMFALDAQTGEQLWHHEFRSVILPGKGGYQGTFLCPNGITATPAADPSTGILHVIAPNGSLYGLDLGSGEVRYGPIQFVAPFAKSWSLNVVNGVVYTVLTQGCGGGVSGFYSADVRDPHHPVIHQMLLSNTDTAGMWGRGGPVIGENGRVYGSTADGHFSVQAGDYSNSVVSAEASDLKLLDYFLPPNWLDLANRDLDLGAASPLWFGWKDRQLVASGAKDGVLYLMDANALGGGDHQTPMYTSAKLGNEKRECCRGLGIWGGLASARDLKGDTWLYVPMGGPAAHDAAFPVTHGDAPHGSIMAFRVVVRNGGPALEPAWISRDFNLPDPPVIANGIVFALSTGENAVQNGGEEKRLLNTHPAVLYALGAYTGKELFNSGDAITGWVHFSGLAVADGLAFSVDHDSTVYCFGLKK